MKSRVGYPKPSRSSKAKLAMGARLEDTTHPHARRAPEMGVSLEEIKHAVLLAMTTPGFPGTVSVYTWIDDVLNKK